MTNTKRLYILLVFCGATGMFWSHETIFRQIALFGIRPAFTGILVAILWRKSSVFRLVLITIVAMTGIEIISNINYALSTSWHYILKDGDTQSFIVWSYIITALVAIVATILTAGSISLLKTIGPNQARDATE